MRFGRRSAQCRGKIQVLTSHRYFKPLNALICGNTYLFVWQDLVEDSEDDRGFDEISETAPPIELPAAELARLEVLSIFWPISS